MQSSYVTIDSFVSFFKTISIWPSVSEWKLLIAPPNPTFPEEPFGFFRIVDGYETQSLHIIFLNYYGILYMSHVARA